MRRSPTETKLPGMIPKICKILLLDFNFKACTQKNALKICTNRACSFACDSFQNARGLKRGSIGKELSLWTSRNIRMFNLDPNLLLSLCAHAKYGFFEIGYFWNIVISKNGSLWNLFAMKIEKTLIIKAHLFGENLHFWTENGNFLTFRL